MGVRLKRLNKCWWCNPSVSTLHSNSPGTLLLAEHIFSHLYPPHHLTRVYRQAFWIHCCIQFIRNSGFSKNFLQKLTLFGMSSEKCSSLAPPRSIFYKTHWAWQGVKLIWLIRQFSPPKKIQLTKSDPKRTSRRKVPCLMPIRVNT